MILKMYTVRDRVTGFYKNPMLFRNDGEAIRLFERALKDEKSDMSQNPLDYELVRVASWNDEDASIDASDAHVKLSISYPSKTI